MRDQKPDQKPDWKSAISVEVHVHGLVNVDCVSCMYQHGPLPPSTSHRPLSPLRGEVLTVCTCANISVKWKIILAKNTELSFAIDSSSDLTCRTLLEYYFSDVGVPFSKCTVKQKSNKLIC